MTSAVSRRGLQKKTGMLRLLSCDSDMTAWLKHKQKGLSVSGEEDEDLVVAKLQVIQKISQRSNAQMAFITIQGTEERFRDDIVVSNCLFMVD